MGLCDSGGRVHNNMGEIGWSFDAKMNLCANCMHGLAFENRIKKGYITEKIYECLMVGAVPYYYGTADVVTEFNPKAYYTFDASSNEAANRSLQQMVDRLNDDGAFGRMRSEDPFTGFGSEKYIKHGKTMLRDFIMNTLETK
jgi:hypothetical protein